MQHLSLKHLSLKKEEDDADEAPQSKKKMLCGWHLSLKRKNAGDAPQSEKEGDAEAPQSKRRG